MNEYLQPPNEVSGVDHDLDSEEKGLNSPELDWASDGGHGVGEKDEDNLCGEIERLSHISGPHRTARTSSGLPTSETTRTPDGKHVLL